MALSEPASRNDCPALGLTGAGTQQSKLFIAARRVHSQMYGSGCD